MKRVGDDEGSRGRAPNAWKTSVFDIVKSPLICISTIVLPPATYYLISGVVDEVPASIPQSLCGGYCCFYGFQIRSRLRHKYNLKGSVGGDLLSHCLCHCFALTHDFREAVSWKGQQWSAESLRPAPDVELSPPPCTQATDEHRLAQDDQFADEWDDRNDRVPDSSAGWSQSASNVALRLRLEILKSGDDVQTPPPPPDSVATEQGSQTPATQRPVPAVAKRNQKLEVILTDEAAINEMKDELSQDFDPSRMSYDIPAMPLTVFEDFPEGGDDPSPAAAPRHVPTDPPARREPRPGNLPARPPALSPPQNGFGGSQEYVELSPGVTSARMGLRNDGFLQVDQPHGVTATGAREFGQYGVRPVAHPPEYPGNVYYSYSGSNMSSPSNAWR